jgi:hypothetical protein
MPVDSCPRCGSDPYIIPAKMQCHDYTCIVCYRKIHRDKLRKYRKEKRPALMLRDQRHSRLQRERFPEKIEARRLVSVAVRTGRLIKPIACNCGAIGRIEAHHHMGYDKPLEIKWLCVSCHHLEHRAKAAEEKV